MAEAGEPTEMTAADYLALDRAADVRHEFINGRAYAMAGGSPEHAALIANLSGALWSRLRGGPCHTTSADQRLHVPATGAFVYADLSVVCGPFEYHPGADDTLTNPTVIFEVLSPSTADYDRGAKFDHYKRLGTLREYVLVHPDQRRIEHRVRQDDGAWLLRDVTERALVLAALGVEVPLDEVYELDHVRGAPAAGE